MTETPSKPAKKAAAKSPSKSGGLSSMLLADLKSMAAGLGIAGAGSMKKAQLVDAIKATQSGGGAKADTAERPQAESPSSSTSDPAPTSAPDAPPAAPSPRRCARAPASSATAEQKQDQAEQKQDQADRQIPENAGDTQDQKDQQSPQQDKQQDQQDKQDKQQDKKKNQQPKQNQQGGQSGQQDKQQDRQDRNQQDRNQQDRNQQDRNQQDRNQRGQSQQNQQDQLDDDDDGEGGSRRNRRRRGRDRTTTRQGAGAGGRNEPDTTILEDDVLVPAAGILDVLDNCAFVRTSGYLPGPEDVYLSLSMVRKYHLRRGDAVVGQVRQPREGERREKFNPMVRIDSVNGTEAEGAKERPDFADAVPVHPHQRLRLATDDANLTGKVIDIASPVGKGQRGLILTPPRTGATSLLQSIAQAVTTNNPECHVMVVLVDARPEEVTDFQRAVKGEVVASTFDRQPADHTLVAELAIERAKRLVELGHDVVVLLDSLTRLGRAYNLAAPANGRVLAGIVDASAVHPTKEFFGAARKIEDAGSLTVLATVAVGTGSATDEFFLEEIAGTENLELALSAERAAKGIVPAVDVAASGTRHEEKLLAPAEGAVVGDIRKRLAAADSQQAVTKVVGGR